MAPLTLVDRTPVHHVRAGNPVSARALAVVVHGLGEHLGRHAMLVDRLAQAGFAVAAYDQRGHGESGGARGRIPHDEALLADLGCIIDHERAAQPDLLPLVLVGHSLGGTVAARFVAEGLRPQPAGWFRRVQGLVLTSPALAADLNPWQRLQLSLGRLAPDLPAPNGLKPAWICSDPAVVEAYRRDPLVHDRITPRLARWLLRAGGEVIAAAPEWAVPTLLMWAEADRCVAAWGSGRFARGAPPERVTARPWPGLRHEILNEPDNDDVWACLWQWLDQQFPARRPMAHDAGPASAVA